MANTFQTYTALPDGCTTSLAQMVPEERVGDMIRAYCNECDTRHAFIPAEDE